MRNDLTRANAVSESKKSFRKFQTFSFAIWTNTKRKRASDDETNKKNIAGQVLTYNSTNFNWLNKLLNLKRTLSELEKPFLKTSDKKQKLMSKCRIRTKNHKREKEIWFKQKNKALNEAWMD